MLQRKETYCCCLSVPVCRYGLGMIYYKQEKFNLAEMHFKKALSINPQSSVLLCHIGVVSSFYLTKSKCTKAKNVMSNDLIYEPYRYHIINNLNHLVTSGPLPFKTAPPFVASVCA